MINTTNETEELEEDLFAVFHSLLMRINEDRIEPITILDKEIGKAIKGYVKDNPHDKIIFGD